MMQKPRINLLILALKMFMDYETTCEQFRFKFYAVVICIRMEEDGKDERAK